jgi:aromatic ring-opening dioxygenase catalytic subunit (LigB family)
MTNHLAGPLPLLRDPDHIEIIQSLKSRVPQILKLDNQLLRPRAIVLITAHWSTDSPTISTVEKPDLIYDYYGYPPEAYNITYSGRGDLQIANEIVHALEKEGIVNASLDSSRGWDHGVYVPMIFVNPQADLPIVQMSVLSNEDAKQHLRIGRALRALRNKNVAVVGSGFASFHNLNMIKPLRDASSNRRSEIREMSSQWSDSLWKSLSISETEQRWEALMKWRHLPFADTMHPPLRGDHMMPLLITAGAAFDDEPTKYYKDKFLGLDILTYYWDN